MAKNKNYQDKNTVSGNKEETSMKNCGKNQNSAKNRETSSAKNTAKNDMEEYDEY